LVDRHVGIDADETWAMTRRLARQAGLFVGLSSGAAMAGAIEVASTLEEGVVVTLMPDDGSKYISLGLFDRS
jgi:cysteine synthase